MSCSTEERMKMLAGLGASADESAELLRYNANHFSVPDPATLRLPLDDEPFVEVWEFFAAEAERSGNITAIYPWVPQLQFPVRGGISAEPQYMAAVKRGEFAFPDVLASGLALERPEQCRLRIHRTAAGRIPVLSAATRADFVSLVQAFAKKGEPEHIPDSMGAVIVGGYNNFHRIHRLRQAFLQRDATGDWAAEFQRIKEQRELYQDRFIILSPGPYSGVTAESLGLEEAAWLQLSLIIRLEHECTHYFTRRVFGSMRNNLLDELMADFCGIVAATGAYNVVWAMQFLGCQMDCSWRAGGRIENYRGNPPLSEGAFQLLVRLVLASSRQLAALSRETVAERDDPAWKAAILFSIASFQLDELALQPVVEVLVGRYRQCLVSLHRAADRAGAGLGANFKKGRTADA